MIDSTDPTIIRGYMLTAPEQPSVLFVYATAPHPTHPHKHNLPVVIVTGDVDPDDVIAAAESIGRRFSRVGDLRRAAKAWAKTDDARRNPYRVAGAA